MPPNRVEKSDMKVVGLDGVEYRFPDYGHGESKENKKQKSKLHESARDVIKSVYPNDTILQEVPIYGCGKLPLYLDFYLPLRAVCIEVMGKQHYQWIPHFHKTKAEFLKAVVRDKKKEEFCELNCIKLVVFRFDEDEDVWRKCLREVESS